MLFSCLTIYPLSDYIAVAVADERRRVEEELTDHLAGMEHRLNDARREHTKSGRWIVGNLSLVYVGV